MTTGGKESHSLDLRGNPDANPLFVKETKGGNWKASDFRLKAGSPACGAGRALPAAIAKKLGTDAGGAVNMGALVNAAWNDEQPAAKASAPHAAEQPAAPAAPAQAPSAAPTTEAPAAAAPAPAGGAAQGSPAKQAPTAGARAAEARAEIAKDVKPKARTVMAGGALLSLLISILGPYLRRRLLSMRA
ncbi:hypothetical protein ABXS69_05035 [Actinomyces timonensis]|uniref:Uncharacterized protein n=1 Tax=Actinomyces timonensis TaxID=1288391 RepID=A0AAU8N5T3_9ACTO